MFTKICKRILLTACLCLTLFCFLPQAKAANSVDLYLFYGDGCPHCAHEKEFLSSIQDKYPNLSIHSYETWYNEQNIQKLENVGTYLNKDISGVPFTIVGDRTFTGYSDSIGKQIEQAIVYYSENKYDGDIAGIIDGTISPTPKEETSETLVDQEPQQEKKETPVEKEEMQNYQLSVPFFGDVDVKTLSLPVLSILLGTLDGFNPCAMWILLFLISMLLGMDNKKRMWALGLTFLITSALVYLLFMVSWLNFTKFIGTVSWLRMIIAVVALIGGLVNLISYFKTKQDGCHVVNERKRKKVFGKIKRFTSEKKFILAFLGIIALAVSVNLIELACSAGLPIIFTQILSMNHLSGFEYGMFIALYILFFLLDDLIVFIIAMTTLKITGISTKYGKLSHLIGGILMVIIAILLVFKPEWLMFQFS